MSEQANTGETVELTGELAETDEPTVMVSGGSALIPVAFLLPGATITLTTTVSITISAPPAPESAAGPEPQRPRHMGSRINAAGA
jgi:hypothetical protein